VLTGLTHAKRKMNDWRSLRGAGPERDRKRRRRGDRLSCTWWGDGLEFLRGDRGGKSSSEKEGLSRGGGHGERLGKSNLSPMVWSPIEPLVWEPDKWSNSREV